MTREELLAELDDLHRFVDAGSQVAWTADGDGGVSWTSPKWLEMTGMTEGGIDGDAWQRLLHPDDLEKTGAVWGAALASRAPYDIEHRLRMADGRFRWMRSRATPHKAPDGTVREWFGWTEDIHERRTAQDVLAATATTFEALVRNSPFGAFVLDDELRFSVISEGARPVVEPYGGRVGSSVLDFVEAMLEPSFAADVTVVYRRVLANGEMHSASVSGALKTGEPVTYDWRLQRIVLPDGRLGLVCHFYDLSERQSHEEALEQAVGVRTAELVRANRDLSEFAYSVAHDLRAPLRAIVSTSRILREDLAERITADEADMLDRQATNALRLSKLVDDMLAFGRLASTELIRRPIDLTFLACGVADEVCSRAPGPREIRIQEKLRATGDASLIRQVLVNLFDNAVKFSPGGEAVTFGKEGDEFVVRDQGIGFDPRHAHKLFVAFERLVDGEAFPGSGVGLANVKRIVERHGGTVRAESEPGHGSAFFFTLPKAG